MPRIKVRADFYADRDFQTAVFTAMVKAGMQCSVCQLAEKMGVGQSTLNTNLRKNPQYMQIHTLRKLVQTIKPDISATLQFIGYTGKDIKKFVEESK